MFELRGVRRRFTRLVRTALAAACMLAGLAGTAKADCVIGLHFTLVPSLPTMLVNRLIPLP